MKILLINGSPKGNASNSLRLAKAFIEGYGDAVPEAETELVNLREKRIEPCRGCFGCWSRTEGRCVIEDDAAELLEKRINADLVIWSFPLYFFNVPGPLKNFIDRQLPMTLPFMERGAESGGHPLRFDISGQKHVLISTCGFYTAGKNYDSVCSMFDHICGKGGYETLFCGQGELFRVKELSSRTDEYLELCRRAGREFAGGGISPETRKGLSRLRLPRETFERLADASWGVNRSTGKKEPEALSFTRQMAGLYNKKSWDGHDRVLEMHYTDLGETYWIMLEKDGSRVLEKPEKPCTTLIETPFDVWRSIAAGEMRGDAALMEGKYRVKGDFSLMTRWKSFFGADEDDAPVRERSEKKPPLLLSLLLTWMALWIGVSIDERIGAFAALCAVALIPVITLGFEKTVYDTISTSLAALLCGLALLTGKGELAVCIGYAAFGLMWLLSCLTREPLCAAYVKKDYGGDDALNNPIFIRTNRIIAAAWGALYLVIAAAAFFMSRAGKTNLLQAIIYALTALMGVFTVWFQKWYPAHVAAGK